LQPRHPNRDLSTATGCVNRETVLVSPAPARGMLIEKPLSDHISSRSARCCQSGAGPLRCPSSVLCLLTRARLAAWADRHSQEEASPSSEYPLRDFSHCLGCSSLLVASKAAQLSTMCRWWCSRNHGPQRRRPGVAPARGESRRARALARGPGEGPDEQGRGSPS
jgi:hypothetical protein